MIKKLFSYSKIDDLNGVERGMELMGEARQRNRAYESETGGGYYKANSKVIAEEIVKADKESRVVYCRFGKQYIANLEKQMNSLLNNKDGNGT